MSFKYVFYLFWLVISESSMGKVETNPLSDYKSEVCAEVYDSLFNITECRNRFSTNEIQAIDDTWQEIDSGDWHDLIDDEEANQALKNILSISSEPIKKALYEYRRRELRDVKEWIEIHREDEPKLVATVKGLIVKGDSRKLIDLRKNFIFEDMARVAQKKGIKYYAPIQPMWWEFWKGEEDWVILDLEDEEGARWWDQQAPKLLPCHGWPDTPCIALKDVVCSIGAARRTTNAAYSFLCTNDYVRIVNLEGEEVTSWFRYRK